MPVGLPAIDAISGLQQHILSSNLPLAVELAINPKLLVQSQEPKTIPTTPFQITIAPPNGRDFGGDLGVRFTATQVALTRVSSQASAPTTGQYSEDFGIYTFAAADTGLGVQISYSYASGDFDVSWCITGGTLGLAPTQVAAGSMTMKSADPVAKLLYVIRGAWLGAVQNLTFGQIVTQAWQLDPSLTKTGALVPPKGSSFYARFPVDMIAALPSNPSNIGL